MSVLDLFRTETRSFDLDTDTEAFGGKSYSGENVTPSTALKLVAVYACITLISDAVRAMPVDVFTGVGPNRVEVPPPLWLTAPNSDQSWGQFLDYGMNSLLTRGNLFILVSARDTRGNAEEIWALHPDDVKVEVADKQKRFVWGAEQKVFKPLTALNPTGEVLHIMSHTEDGLVGLSPIEQAQQAIGWGLATEKFGSSFFGQGAQPSSVLEMPPGSQPTADQLKHLSADFRRKFSGTDNAWKPIVLANGASYKPISLPNDQAQFIESRSFSVSEIARLYRVPPHLIGDLDRSTSWGTGIEQQNIGFVQHTLLPWLTRLEEAFKLLLSPGEYVKFNANALLRGDQKTRFDVYQQGINNGILTPNEARGFEELSPLEGLDSAFLPLSLGPADQAGVSATDANTISDAVGKFIRAGFTPESSLLAVVSGDFEQLIHTGLVPITIKDKADL